jgi:hypothetical protein
MSLTSKPHINNWSTSFQLLSPSLRCCSSPLYVQSSTGDTVIVDLSLLRQEKVEQKCQCMIMYGYRLSWWHLMTMMCAVSRMCLHMSPYFIRPLTKDQLHPPSGSRELSKRHSQFSKCAHRPKSPTGCKSQSGLMRVQYLDADPRWSKGFWGAFWILMGFSIFFKLWGPGNARKSQNKHASCGLNSKALRGW